MRIIKTQAVKNPRRGLMGNKELDADYMNQVKDRARRMKAAMRDQDRPTDTRQLRLPWF